MFVILEKNIRNAAEDNMEEGYCDICGNYTAVADTEDGLLCEPCFDPNASPDKVISFETLPEEEQEGVEII